jgi:hypothetical protein
MKSMEIYQQSNYAYLAAMILAEKSLLPDIPFSVSRFPLSDFIHAAFLDQFLFRFIKMQDSMAKRLIPAVYSVLEIDSSPLPFLDMLSRLEKLGVLESVDTWQFFRDLRNNLAHDKVSNLNLLFHRWTDFTAIYQNLKIYCRRRFPEE